MKTIKGKIAIAALLVGVSLILFADNVAMADHGYYGGGFYISRQPAYYNTGQTIIILPNECYDSRTVYVNPGFRFGVSFGYNRYWNWNSRRYDRHDRYDRRGRWDGGRHHRR